MSFFAIQSLANDSNFREIANEKRELANFVVREDLQESLLRPKGMYFYLTLEDDRGILRQMKQQFKGWNKDQEYVESWNLNGFANYKVEDVENKKSYLSKMLIKYLDKRISGEIKKAEEGTTFHRIGQVQKALSPSATLKFSDKVKLRFKGRILEGKGSLIIENPYIQTKSEFNKDGELKVVLNKNIKELGLTYHTDYYPLEGQYITTLSKNLFAQVTASLSSSQSDKEIMMSSSSNRTLSMKYHSSF